MQIRLHLLCQKGYSEYLSVSHENLSAFRKQAGSAWMDSSLVMLVTVALHGIPGNE